MVLGDIVAQGDIVAGNMVAQRDMVATGDIGREYGGSTGYSGLSTVDVLAKGNEVA